MSEQRGIVWGIRLKVLIGFGLVLLAVAFAGIINFISLNRMVASVKVLAQPDEKLIYIRRLMGHLSNEENSVRSYTLTQDDRYLNNYHQLADSVHSSLAQLKVATIGNNQQNALTDSIQQLVAEREGLLLQFIGKRKSDMVSKPNSSNSHSKHKSAASKVRNGATQATADSSVHAKKKGVFGWVKNAFSSSNKKEKKHKSEDQKKILSDSLAQARAMPSDSEVNALLTRETLTLKKQMQEWTLDEMVMLQQDKEMMDRIRSKIRLLEENENFISSKQAAAASAVADSAHRIMTFIGILGILSSLIFIYLILTDVARSNRLREQLLEERKRAEKLTRVKEEFLANMSHEIRTPLNAIVGFTEQLSKEDQKDRQQQFLRAIENSSQHLLSIVNQILDFSRIESGKWQLEEEPFDFHELIREVHETLRIKALEKNILFSYRIDENVPRFVTGAALSTKQIIINLVSNAIKFTEKGGVSIECIAEEETDDIVKIRTEVKDTGIGVDPEMQQKIFEEFTQNDPSITRRFGGTGLGLTITKKLTELLSGKIGVRSNEGVGSIFTLIIPFKKSGETAVADHEPAKFQDLSFLQNKSVLIVDDEKMNIMLCKTILENKGVTTDSASNGAEALEKFQNHDYDFILLDVQMPEMSGIEVARRIRASEDEVKKSVPLIALTADVFSKKKKEMGESGFNEVLIKPFKENELFASIRNILFPEEKQTSEIKMNEQEHPSSAKQNGRLFSLEYLEKTSGANPPFIINMLQSFIHNNEQHLHLLDEAQAANDWNQIYRITHKMIPSYRYLQIDDIESKLKLLEKISEEKTELEKAPELISDIRAVTEKVFTLLQEEIKALQQAEEESIVPEETTIIQQK